MRFTVGFYCASVPITLDVRDGRAGLGGSESACFGLARALATAGHDVHIHAQRLAEDARGKDDQGVTWHDAGEHDSAVYDWCTVVEPDVFVSLRMAHIYAAPVRARLRVLWNQDLLVPPMGQQHILSAGWQIDQYWYVSEYHRQQWEGVCPEIKGLGHVIKNGYDPAHVPVDVAKVPGRVCYITRPERGLEPLLQMWPAVKAAVPYAELHVTRYASMYDGEGGAVKAMCESFDRLTERVAQETGGIVVHAGGLGKAALYELIASSEVMWYPGVAGFAETSCVAAIEAQACGTPFVGSMKGALRETVPLGTLLYGDAMTPEYQAESVAAVKDALKGLFPLAVRFGLKHVAAYTYDAIAADLTAWLMDAFTRRCVGHERGILRQLLQYDDHTAALRVAEAMDPVAHAFCQRVIAGQDQTADDYGERAQPDVLLEATQDARLRAAGELLAGCTRVLDIASGNGAFGIGHALRNPDVTVVGFDYSADNIARARAAAIDAGVADRVTFEQAVIYDFDAQDVDTYFVTRMHTDAFDGCFCGEFFEHVGNVKAVCDTIAAACVPGSPVVATMPSGPFTEMMPPGVPVKRGHVHHFCYDDLTAIFGAQDGMQIGVLQLPHLTPRGNPVAHWCVTYRTSDTPFGSRDYAKRILTTRPMPRLSVGIIAGPGCALDLPKCLETVHKVADEIVIGLCGVDTKVEAVASEYGARIIRMPEVKDLRGGFGEARNTVLAECTGEWFMWIDADELLMNAPAVRKYLDTALWNGYVLRQNHLQLDAPNFHDKPVRLFRRKPGVQFYGVVHEQPQDGDANVNVLPAVDTGEVQIAHLGYLTDGIRRRKSLTRNLALLVRDKMTHPERTLGKAIWMREFSTWLSEIGQHRSTYPDALQIIAEQYGPEAVSAVVFDGQPVPRSGLALARFACEFYERTFPDPADPHAELARPFYETCLCVLPESWEVDFTLAARQGGMKGGKAAPSPFWTRSDGDAERMVAKALKPLQDAFHPVPLQTDPFPVTEGVPA